LFRILVCRIHHDELMAIDDSEVRLNRMIELNTIEQCINIFKIGLVQRHQAKYGFPRIHGLVYNLGSGELNELDINFKEYIKKYSSVYKLHSFDSPDPDSLRREKLQQKAIRTLAKDHEGDSATISVSYLRRAMANEPLLFSETEIEGALAHALRSASDKSAVEVEDVVQYFKK
jgi:hypothetical protein